MKNAAKITGQIRHAVSALGVYLVATGSADQATADAVNINLEQVIGGGMALAAALMSWFDKSKTVGNGDLPKMEK